MIGYVKQGDTVGTVYSDLQAREGRTGREAVSRPAVQCYPNPVQQTLYLTNLSPAQVAEVRVINQTGQVVQAKAVRGPEAQLTMHSLDPGMYVVRIREDERLLRKKVIKR